MRFLKVSTIIIFVLSLLAGGVTIYLSALRENEKEKRIHVEGVLQETEERVKSLESEKADLTSQLTTAESQIQQLSAALDREKMERAKVVNLVSQKDTQLKSTQNELAGTKKSFERAQQQNREMEKILKGLEARLRDAEARAKEASEKLKELEAAGPANATNAQAASLTKESSGGKPRPSFIRQISLVDGQSSDVVKQNNVTLAREKNPEQVKAEPVKPKKKFWLTRFFSKIFGFFFHHRNVEVTPAPVHHPAEEKTAETMVMKNTSQSDLSLTERRELPAAMTASEKKVNTEPKSELKTVDAKQEPFKQPEVSKAPASTPTSLKGKLPSIGVPKSETKPAEDIKVETKPEMASKASKEGKVLLINRNFHFVVVNVGSKNGLSPSDILLIKRNGKQVAKVRVEKVYDEYSAAYIVEEDSSLPIEESDLVSEK